MRLRLATEQVKPHALISEARVADQNILQRHIDSISNPNMGLPRFPSVAIQEQYNGRSGAAALEAAWPFFEKLTATVPVKRDTCVLDFGVGWGRIARLFDGLTDKMLLADISQEAINLTRSCGVRGKLIKTEHGGKLPIEKSSVDLVYSNSVFSHISEESARHWLTEIAQVMKVGSSFVFTTLSMRFIHLVKACRNKQDASEIEKRIGGYLSDPDSAAYDFARNRYVFSGKGGGPYLSAQHYGWAVIPEGWLAAETRGSFIIEECIEAPEILKQTVFVLRRI